METSVTLEMSSIYLLFSNAFLYPEEELFAKIQDRSIIKDLQAYAGGLDSSAQTDFFKTIENLRSSLEGFTLEQLQAEYIRIFGHTISKECPPYETEYGGMHIYQRTHELGDIAGFYKAFGVEVSDTIRERMDHISTQLEFMYFLTYKEAYAQEHYTKDKTEICREAQRKFLKEHLGRWSPLFLELLVQKAESGFYKELAHLTGYFLDFEAQFLNVKPEEIQNFQTIPSEPEEECKSCYDTE
jgi:DMSO reductase family type II enzyme chaperone